jgi:SAM-dependent methyltransferase
MDVTTQARLKTGFDQAADAYATSRPGYPADAVRWLLYGDAGAGDDSASLDVLDLGAGSGSLTLALPGYAGQVVAAEPSLNLLTELRRAAPEIPAVRAGAESLPFADGGFDVVTVATAFHWFEPDRALPEIARVLRPGGHLALVWNSRVHETVWTQRLNALLRSAMPPALQGDWGVGSVRALDDSRWFLPPERATFEHEQPLDRAGLVSLVASRSYVIALDSPAREALLTRVGELYDATVGPGGTLAMPYHAKCFRSAVRPPAGSATPG